MNKIKKIYSILYKKFGPQGWWPTTLEKELHPNLAGTRFSPVGGPRAGSCPAAILDHACALSRADLECGRARQSSGGERIHHSSPP